MTWPKVRLDSLCDVTSSKRIFAADYTSEGVPFYRAKEISEKHNGALSVSSELFISRSQFETLRSKFGAPKPGDLLLTSIGALLGEPYVVKCGEEFYFKDGNLTWFRKLDGIDSYFLYYWMISPQGKGELERAKIGSAQPAFTIILLKQMVVGLPLLPFQQRIASILSAYDDLIESNTRRIKILEEMAQRLYREWFVNFRFPGHERVRMVDSELGPIPEGWAIESMKNVAEVIDCLHSKKPDATEGGPGLLLQLFNIADGGKLDLTKQYRITKEQYEQWTSRIEVQGGDCVVTNVGRIGAVAQIPNGLRAAIGRNMTAIRPKIARIGPAYLIEYLLSPYMASEVALKKDAGTIMDSLNVKGIVKLSVPVPPPQLMKQFEANVGRIRRRIELAVEQNLNLRTTRNLLLPKLISGEIPVDAAGEAAAELMEHIEQPA